MSRHRRRGRRGRAHRTAPFTVLAAIIVAVTVGGVGSAAYAWTRTAPTTSTARAASLGVVVTASNAITGTYRWSGSAQSPVYIGSLTVQNSGSAVVTYAFSAGSAVSPLSSATHVWLWAPNGGTCGTSVPGSGVIDAGRLPTASATFPSSIGTATAGAPTTTLCIGTEIVGISNFSVQGQSNLATFTVRGTLNSWSATASGTATQRVYQVPSVPTLTCTDTSLLSLGVLLHTGIELRWPTVAGITTYRVNEKVGTATPTSFDVTVASGAPSATATRSTISGASVTYEVVPLDTVASTRPTSTPSVTATRLNSLPKC